jgi:hypothetical protein
MPIRKRWLKDIPTHQVHLIRKPETLIKFDKLDDVRHSSVIGINVGHKNFRTVFARKMMGRDEVVAMNSPHSAVQKFNSGRDEQGNPLWSEPDAQENRISTEQAKELTGHDMASKDGAVRFATGLVAEEGLIRPVVFALEGQFAPSSKMMEAENVVGIFSPEGAKYSSIHDAIAAAHSLQPLSEGNAANYSIANTFSEEKVPTHLKKAYGELEQTFAINEEKLGATVIQSGVPLGMAIRKLGKIEGHQAMLSDAALVLAGSDGTDHNRPAYGYAELRNLGESEKPYTIPQKYYVEATIPEKSWDSEIPIPREIRVKEAALRHVAVEAGADSKSAILLEESIRHSAKATGFHEEPKSDRPLLPPQAPRDMFSSHQGRIAIMSNVHAREKEMALASREKEAKGLLSRAKDVLDR